MTERDLFEAALDLPPEDRGRISTAAAGVMRPWSVSSGQEVSHFRGAI